MAIKVLYLTNNPNRGSTTSPTEGWFRELRPLGLEPIVVSHEVGQFQRWLTTEEIPSYHIDLTAPDREHLWRFASTMWRLRRIVRRHGIQLVHCNEQPLYATGRHLAKLCGLPIAVSVHSVQSREFWVWAFGRALPDRIYFVSRGCLQANSAAFRGIIPEERGRILNNALNLQHYSRDPAKGREFRDHHGLAGKQIIGVACALRMGKQVEHLIEATARLGDDTTLLLAGGGIQGELEYADNLLRLARERLGNRFVHVGHLSDLRPFMHALDLFVNTSKSEACSISVLEALSAGCPVIGYPSKSVYTQILPGGGEIVAQDSLDELVAVIRRWLSDPNLLAAGRNGARRRVEEEFDIRLVSRQLLADYRELLENRGPHRWLRRIALA